MAAVFDRCWRCDGTQTGRGWQVASGAITNDRITVGSPNAQIASDEPVVTTWDDLPMARTSRAPDETTLSPLFYLHIAQRRCRALVIDAMVESPLTPDEYAVYSLLFEIAPVSATKLAAELGIPVTTALDLVRTLQARGHLLKERDPEDGRAMRVRLTPTGLAAQRSAMRFFQTADLALGKALSAAGLQPSDVSRVLLALGDAAESAMHSSREASIEAG